MPRYDEDWMEDHREQPEDEAEHLTGWCSECGKACTSVTVDEGIGPYEYWGSRGTHHDYVEESPCCNAPMSEEPEEETEDGQAA